MNTPDVSACSNSNEADAIYSTEPMAAQGCGVGAISRDAEYVAAVGRWVWWCSCLHLLAVLFIRIERGPLVIEDLHLGQLQRPFQGGEEGLASS